jgi:uncharacterized protein (TIGR00369 family)
MQHEKASGRARRRTITWEDPLAGAATGRLLSGLEYLCAMRDGRLPPAPIAELLDMRSLEIDNGRVLFTAVPQEFHYNPLGFVHGALAAALLDSAAGCAVHSTLPAGVGYTTLDLNVTFVRPLSAESGRLLCEGKVVHRGRRVATAEVRLWTERDDKLAAHGTATCLILSELPEADPRMP